MMHVPKQIPFIDELPLTSANLKLGNTPVEWQENEPFEDTLQFVGFVTGWTTRAIWFSDTFAAEVEMFLGDFEKVVPDIYAGVLRDTFVFVQVRDRYGIRRG